MKQLQFVWCKRKGCLHLHESSEYSSSGSSLITIHGGLVEGQPEPQWTLKQSRLDGGLACLLAEECGEPSSSAFGLVTTRGQLISLEEVNIAITFGIDKFKQIFVFSSWFGVNRKESAWLIPCWTKASE